MWAPVIFSVLASLSKFVAAAADESMYDDVLLLQKVEAPSAVASTDKARKHSLPAASVGFGQQLSPPGALSLDEFMQAARATPIKFFMYPVEEFDPRFMGSFKNCDRKGGDYSFVQSLQSSENRVWSADEADMVVVPCLFESQIRCAANTGESERPPKLWNKGKQDNFQTDDSIPRDARNMIAVSSAFLNGDMFPQEGPVEDDMRRLQWAQAFDRWTRTCLQKVLNTPTYKKKGGADHVWVAADWHMNFGKTAESDLIRNLTIGRIEVLDEAFPSLPKPKNRCSFVVPYPSDMAYVEPWSHVTSFEDWFNRRHVVHYRFANRTYSVEGSPDVRRLRTQSLELARLFGPSATVAATRVKLDQFFAEGHDAKFCLVIKGDTPSSHGFYDALAASCVPILISDQWEAAAVPFAVHQNGLRGGLQTSEYVLQFTEKQWMSNVQSVKAEIDKILNDANKARELFQSMQAHRGALLWAMPDNTVTEAALYSAKQCMKAAS